MLKLVLVCLLALVLTILFIVLLVRYFVTRARAEVVADLLETYPSLFVTRPDHTHMISGTIREDPHPGGRGSASGAVGATGLSEGHSHQGSFGATGPRGLSSPPRNTGETPDALSQALDSAARAIEAAFGPLSRQVGREARVQRTVVVTRTTQRQKSQPVNSTSQQPTRKSRYERDPVI